MQSTDQFATRGIAERERSLRAKTPGSLERYQRSMRTLAGGVSSGMRRTARPYPLFFERGEGSRMWDVDGNAYIDFTLAWGPLILGHSPACVVDAIRDQAPKGLTFGAQHELEYRVSELLADIIPCADQVAYSNSGTEIVQVALRLARAVTGRSKYLKFEGHYHGWSDQALVSYHPSAEDVQQSSVLCPISAGAGQLPHDHVIIAAWNDVESVQHAFDRHGQGISAIFCEPLLANSGSIPPETGFLEFLREVADSHGALLVFDEVITGFRLGLGGGQAYYGVTPDLATFAKAVGAGVPLSVLAGRADYMQLIADGTVIHAGNTNGNPLCLAAGHAALHHLAEQKQTIYPRLHSLGQKLSAGLVSALREAGHDAVCTGEGAVFSIHLQKSPPKNYRDTLVSDRKAWSDFVLALLDEGVLVLPDGRWYISAAHTETDIDETLDAASRAARF